MPHTENAERCSEPVELHTERLSVSSPCRRGSIGYAWYRPVIAPLA